ncbi:heme-binding domain-containing protein [Danxiaibacter flavus]|uniref:Heme-binding domain-containing protein n=1 Tax=Danxiaibacter flavus TaxID=3049108 RepID=A0ABV3ZM78_9BACT|nr:heme-binding domain-containing protein [Chitinophagaceae bacterium DXS]
MKKVIMLIAAVFIIIQFFRPQKNISSQVQANAIEQHYAVPQNVSTLLKTACYNCHSNNTSYPWYNNIQPIAWWLSGHVNEGKEELNFDEFNLYTVDKKKKKLHEITKSIKEGEMPLSSYTLIHTNAKLSKQQQDEITEWATSLENEIR